VIGRNAGPLEIASNGKPLVQKSLVADNFWTRFLGLQFRQELQPDTGLLLFPDTSIHMFFMRFPINLLFLDRDGVVVEIYRNVLPWTVVICHEKTAVAALELSIHSEITQIGEKLVLRGQPDSLKKILN